jgi:hypothetical protein
VSLNVQAVVENVNNESADARFQELVSLDTVKEKGLAQAMSDALIAQVSQGNTANVEFLLSLHAVGTEACTEMAIKDGNIEILDLLVQSGAPLPEKALLFAQNDDIAMIEYLLANPSSQLKDLDSALAYAVENKWGEDAITELVQLGANPQAGLNATITKQSVQWDIFELLVGLGADINKYSGPEEYPILSTLMIISLVRNGSRVPFETNAGYINRAIELGANLNALGGTSGTGVLDDCIALYQCSAMMSFGIKSASRIPSDHHDFVQRIRDESLQYLKLFVDAGADVNLLNVPTKFTSTSGKSSAMMIPYNRHSGSVTASLHASSYTPLQWAINSSSSEMVTYLVDHGADTSVLSYLDSWELYFIEKGLM